MKRVRSRGDEACASPVKKRWNKTSVQKELTSGNMYFTKIEGLSHKFNNFAFSLREILDTITPTNSIHFNFMIDPHWLLSQYPEQCRDTPIMLVVGEKMGTDASTLTQLTKLPIPFGTHHTKLSIFECESKLHVLISTANLIEGDWDLKTQCIYYANGPINNEEVESSDFQKELMSYLEFYKNPELEYWIQRIQHACFSSIKDHIIYSVPGYHKDEKKDNLGLLALRKHLSQIRVSLDKLEGSHLFLAQCSSIGSLGPSFDAWTKPQLLKSMRGGIESEDSVAPKFFLIYPSVTDVRNSVEGYAAGGSLPYQRQTSEKQLWLKDYFCKWRSETNSRSRAMPHCKTYAELVNGEPRWLLVTSANLSKAAWGELQRGGVQMQIRSYEFGVLIADQDRIRLPYDYPIAKYSKTDEPWICNMNYTEKDSCGTDWIVS
ncbi:unnamed protein product [Auanema sp. JU1783]|nr:unnamed protein product [Auanema sp. JU1783]